MAQAVAELLPPAILERIPPLSRVLMVPFRQTMRQHCEGNADGSAEKVTLGRGAHIHAGHAFSHALLLKSSRRIAVCPLNENMLSGEHLSQHQ